MGSDVCIQVSGQILTQKIQHERLTLSLSQTRSRFLQTLDKSVFQLSQLTTRGGQLLPNLLIGLQLRFNLFNSLLIRRNLCLPCLQLCFELSRVSTSSPHCSNRALCSRASTERLDARFRRFDRI